VRSNIEDKTVLEKQVPFVPERIKFSVAEAELLNLLLSPLYGDNPLYGLRELTQNSSDSVQEFEHLLLNGLIVAHDRLEISADIEIEISSEGASQQSITIRDRGTGMTLDVIKNYFLRAGASFRNSERWKRDFVDEHGRSKIARSGRFGVGAVSTFLIGDRIAVYTKHFSERSEDGYFFECSIEDDEIEIKRKKGNVGTIITVASDKDKISRVRSYLSSRRIIDRGFYYCLEKPSLSIINVPDSQNIRRDLKFKNSAKDVWINVLKTEYEEVLWNRRITEHSDPLVASYGYDERPDQRQLYCNGIFVGTFSDREGTLSGTPLIAPGYTDGTFSIRTPTILVTDHNGRLPLNLARTSFTRTDVPLRNAVVTSILEEFIASIFSAPKEDPAELFDLLEQRTYMAVSYSWATLAFCKKGFMPVDPVLLGNLSCRKAVIHYAGSEFLHLLLKDPFYDNACVLIRKENFRFGNKARAVYMLKRDLFGPQLEFHNPTVEPGYHPPLYQLSSESRCLVVPEDGMTRVITESKVAKYIGKVWSARRNVVIEGKRHVALMSTVSPDEVFESVYAFTHGLPEGISKQTGCSFVVLENCTYWTNYETMLSKVWDACFDSPILPYSVTDRQSILKKDAPIRRYLT
jgi:hypothetical protein